MTNRHWASGTVAALLLLVASPAGAQLAACVVPEQLPLPELALPSAREPRRVIPTGGYTLAISWSPQQCGRAGEAVSFQCDTARNRFGFVLHGLWPDGWDKDWPQYCRPASMLSPKLLRTNLCMTPSVDLLQHEWAKHGTCMTRSPKRYFDQARAHYERVRFPDMTKLAQTDGLTVARFTQAFVAANARTLPAVSDRVVRVVLNREGWLNEVHLCMDRRQRFAACRASQNSGAAPERRMTVRMAP